jgi:DNA-binding GntR family transcriptional regulator
MPVAPKEQTTARRRVRDRIQQAILTGEYPPRSRLPQMRLAKHFGVAQTVIRESLLELQFCGLVEAGDNLGVFVSELGPQRLLQAYEIREVFEGLAARLCCQRASRADIGRLVDLAERAYRSGQAVQEAEMGALDRQFHQTSIVISANEVLQRLTEGYRVLGMAVQAERDIREIRGEHLAIVAAIEANRPEEAEHLARQHVRKAREALDRKITAGTFEPRWVANGPEDMPAEEKP